VGDLHIEPGATAAPAEFGGGDTLRWRWTGARGRSPSIELSESALAEYTTAARTAGGFEQVTPDGLTHIGISGRDALTVNTAREPTPDHEVLCRGMAQLGADALDAGHTPNDLSFFLSPGVRYRPDDGAYLFASVARNDAVSLYELRLYYVPSAAATTPTLLATTAIATQPAIYQRGIVICRVEGNMLVGEWYGSAGSPPLQDRSANFVRVTYFIGDAIASGNRPRVEVMGEQRVGYPIAVAWGMGATNPSGQQPFTVLERFEARPYVTHATKLPATVPVRGVPGTAPALAAAHVAGGGATDHYFAALGWRRRRTLENLAWNGTPGAALHTKGWTVTSGGTNGSSRILGTGGSIAASTPGLIVGWPPELYRIFTISAAANLAAGAAFRLNRRLRRGRQYTVSFYADDNGQSAQKWELRIVQDDTFDVVSTAAQTWVANDGLYQFTFTVGAGAGAPTTDGELLDVVFRRASNAATAILQITGLRIYEGPATLDLPDPRPNEGAGAFPPFGVIQAESRDESISGGSGMTEATDAGSTNGRRMTMTAGAAATGYLRFVIDTNLLEPPDFQTDEIDLEVYAIGTVPSTATNPEITLQAREASAAGGFIYTREYGSAGKLLVKPSSGTQRRMWKAGTLTLNRSRRPTGLTLLDLVVTTTGGSGTMAVDCLLLAPTWARLSGPTGKVRDSSYPKFWTAVSNSFLKSIETDGSGVILSTDWAATRDAGLGGEPLELDPGDCELFATAHSGAVPDDPTVNTDTLADMTALVHVAVVPRYRLLSPSGI
jgi:hypothetical protein